MSVKDLLVEIPNSELEKLLELYEERAPWVPHMSALIKTGIKWKQLDEYKKCITFYSPNNCWKEDGTVIITLQFYSQEIYVFTLDEECKNLYKGLSETNRIDYNGTHMYFYAIHEQFVPTVNKIIEEKKLELSSTPRCCFYTISPNEAKNFKIECPEDIVIKKLERSAAAQINEVWPHKYRDSEKFLGSVLEACGGYGIFLKSTNLMVAWIVRHVFGNMIMLQVEEGYRKKRYATILTKVLAKEIAEDGLYPNAAILCRNEIPRKIFEKLGFQSTWTCDILVLKDH